jgi:hypothetical protein
MPTNAIQTAANKRRIASEPKVEEWAVDSCRDVDRREHKQEETPSCSNGLKRYVRDLWPSPLWGEGKDTSCEERQENTQAQIRVKLKTDPAHPMLSKQAAVHPARSFQIAGAKKHPTEHHYKQRIGTASEWGQVKQETKFVHQ